MVEDEVHEKVLVADEEALLPGLEAEAMAHLQEELLQAVEQGVLKVRFAHGILRTDAEELEDVGIADDLGGLEGLGLGLRFGGEFGFVFREAAALVVEAVDLAAQLAHRPVAANALELVEAALGGVGELDQLGQVRERETVDQFGRHYLPILRFGSQ